MQPDESFALYVQTGDDRSLVCVVLRNVLQEESYRGLKLAAQTSTRGPYQEWYTWTKGCGASGLITLRMLRSLLHMDSYVAKLYFGNNMGKVELFFFKPSLD